jgi:hypothetical protein
MLKRRVKVTTLSRQPCTPVAEEDSDVLTEAIETAIAAMAASNVEVVIPPSLVMDFLLVPVGMIVRPEMRDFCLSNLAALPGIDDLTRDRLRRMIREIPT